MNEYSLRGQFDNEYKFFDSLREYTLPALEKVKEEEGKEGRIISFSHEAYKAEQLPLTAFIGEERYDAELDNIWSSEWWKQAPEIRKWVINDKYFVEIRAKEYEYHSPHFHVSSPEYQAVFRLSTGEFQTGSKDRDLLHAVKKWYEEHKAELEQAWNLLHPTITYNKS